METSVGDAGSTGIGVSFHSVSATLAGATDVVSTKSCLLSLCFALIV